MLLPKRTPAFVDRWTVFAWLDAWFITVPTRETGLFVATRIDEIVLFKCYFIQLFVYALVLHIPFSHLTQELEFVIFVFGPATSLRAIDKEKRHGIHIYELHYLKNAVHQ
jgi:hypothetical protein